LRLWLSDLNGFVIAVNTLVKQKYYQEGGGSAQVSGRCKPFIFKCRTGNCKYFQLVLGGGGASRKIRGMGRSAQTFVDEKFSKPFRGRVNG
jgi:hypothetical protein